MNNSGEEKPPFKKDPISWWAEPSVLTSWVDTYVFFYTSIYILFMIENLSVIISNSFSHVILVFPIKHFKTENWQTENMGWHFNPNRWQKKKKNGWTLPPLPPPPFWAQQGDRNKDSEQGKKNKWERKRSHRPTRLGFLGAGSDET